MYKRQGDHHDAHHRDTVHFHVAARILGAQFGASHVAQADDAVGGFAYDQDVFPMMNIRFVAITDNYDSSKKDADLMVA